MLDSGTLILLITTVAAAICGLSLYSVYGNVIRHETTLHDLRNRVEHLQNQKILHEAQITGEIAALEIVPEPIEAIEIPADYEEADFDQLSAEPESSSTNAA